MVLTLLGDPFGLSFDFALWVAASALKIPAWLGLAVLAMDAHRVCFGRGAVARRALLVWIASGAAVVISMAASRGVWAPALSSNVARYYYVGDSFRATDAVHHHRALWESAWTQGWVLVGELALVCLAAAIHASTGWRLGHRPLLSVVTATVISEAVLIAYVTWAPWILLDYDNFHGDVVSGALLLDQLPLASDPYTTVGTLLYCAAAVGCLVIRALGERASA